MPATIANDLNDKLRSVQNSTKEAHQRLEHAKAAAKREGAKVLDPGNEAFTNLDEAGKAYDALREEEATIKDRILRIAEVEGIIEPLDSADAGQRDRLSHDARSIGGAESIVNGEAYKDIAAKLARSESWAIGGQVDLGNLMGRDEFKALVTGTSSTSGGAFVESDLRQELVDMNRRPLSILDLVLVTTTNSDTIEWIRKTARPTAAAFVAEATTTSNGTKPEGGSTFERITAEVKTVAEWVAMTRRAVQDAPRVQGIIESDLLYDLYLKLENSMLTGDGTGATFTGISNTAGIGAYTIGTADPTENVMDAIHRGITMMRLDEEEAEAVMVDPSTWEDIRLSKDDNGQYQYGPPSTAGDMQVWGKRVITTNAQGADSALVGSFRRGAELAFRTGVQTYLADQHSDFFVKNLLALLAEIQAAFLVKRPECFVNVDLAA